jgi:iron-sulfur cluster repair protein YtfE (RIC family)
MVAAPASVDFKALDSCHRQIHEHLGRLTVLVDYLDGHGEDAHARREAAEIEHFFSSTSRDHHAQEENHVFPPLLDSGDEALCTAVRSLQQDHGWIEENWLELAPQLRAIASGNQWTDSAEFRHYAEVFLALCRGHIALEESLIYPESKDYWAAQVAGRLKRLERYSAA